MKLWQTLLRLFARFVRKKPRIVLDTNVLISATLAQKGYSSRILVSARRRRVQVITSPYILDEYLGVVRRPHITRKYKQVDTRADALVRFLTVRGTIVSAQNIERVIPDDPKDDAILACAVEGKAQYIVSGDGHLLQLGSYHGIKILSPRDFVLTILGERANP